VAVTVAPPADVFVGGTATLVGTVTGSPWLTYAWLKNGVLIPGATSSTYTTPPVTDADNGAQFALAAYNQFSAATSAPVVLNVLGNPILVRADTLNETNHVYVFYNKPVNLDGVYTIDAGAIGVAGAAAGADPTIVVLTTTVPIPANVTHTLEVLDVTAVSGDMLLPNPTTVTFVRVETPFPWAVGKKDGGWPAGDGGGPNTSFVQENGSISLLPGNPANPEVDQQGDNDYYFTGLYTTALPGVTSTYGPYTPLGPVLVNEEGAERAYAGGDLDLRYHFNLPSTLGSNDLLAVTYSAINLDGPGSGTTPDPTDPRYGVEVYFNGVKVQDQIVIRGPQLNVDYTTPPFTLASVGAQVGPGYDNIVSLKGISYLAEGGGNWMGIDFVQLNPVQASTWPIQIGQNDNTHIRNGSGGGPNANFMQENGVINALPGTAFGPVVDQQSDNDYYMAGIYTNTIPGVVTAYGAYTPAGLVPINEAAAERAFAGADNDLRYHFNLPSSLAPTDLLTVTFDPLDLDGSVADPHYGVAVYFNGVLVRPEQVMRPADLDKAYTTPAFTLQSVGAQVGPGNDNIVSLKGINYSAEGGGNWMGIDYIQIGPIASCGNVTITPAATPGFVVVTWSAPCRLQAASSLATPPATTTWVDLPYTSPLTVPVPYVDPQLGTFPILFFRAIYP